MCGIAFISPAPGSALDVASLGRELLKVLEARGADAAGYAWRDDQGQAWIVKAPQSGSKLARTTPPADMMDTGVRALLIHTRYATLGDPGRNENNHPIVRPGVQMVHNGHVRNHWKLAQANKISRDAEVDSEVLAAIIELARTDDDALRAFATVEGTAAVAWLKDGDPIGLLHAARLNGSPLVIAQTKDGDTIGCSTEYLMRKACDHLGIALDWVEHLKEGEYITVRDGVIERFETFKTAPSGAYVKPDYKRPSRWSAQAKVQTVKPRKPLTLEGAARVNIQTYLELTDQRKQELEEVFGTLTPEELALFDADDWDTT